MNLNLNIHSYPHTTIKVTIMYSKFHQLHRGNLLVQNTSNVLNHNQEVLSLSNDAYTQR